MAAMEAGVDPRTLVKGRSRLSGRLSSFATSTVVVAAMLALWQVLSDTKVIDPFFVSSPSKVGERLWNMTERGLIWNHTWVTLQEALWGYAIGCAAGILIGFVLGHSKFLAAVFMPLLNLANTLPRVALAPLFILWFGIGQESKIILVFTVVVVILVFNTYSGTQTVEPDLVTNARLLGANRLQVLMKITFPWTLPWILAGLRIALAWSIGAAVIGEYIAARAGLGYLIFFYAGTLDQTGLLAGCAALLILSGIFFTLLGIAERYLLRWRPQSL
jgi:NitT/TauT family transport system permease protein